MSFNSEVTLGIEVDSGELRSAKRAIEDELGDVTVGVSGGGAASRASGGGSAAGGASGQRSRRLFRWARQRTGYMEETVELLSDIEETLDEAGGLVGGGGDGGGLPTVIATGTPSRPSTPGGRAGAAGRVAAGATILPLLASQLFQQRDDVSGQGEGLRAALMASPLGMIAGAGMNLFSPSGQSTPGLRLTAAQQAINGGGGGMGGATNLSEVGGGSLFGGDLQLREPQWLNRLESLLNQNLRITIGGDVGVDASGGLTRGDQEDLADEVIEEVRDEFEGSLEELRRQIISGTGRGSRGSRGRLSPRS